MSSNLPDTGAMHFLRNPMMKRWRLAVMALLCSSAIWASAPWQEGLHYRQGDRVHYRGQVYEALQAHQAVKGANWNPQAAPSLWRQLERVDAAAGHGSWREGLQYSKGQLTSYRGRIYRCLQSHKAEKGAGWSPDRAPSLWEKLDEKPYPQPR
jgi:hypothetical protein